MRWKMNSRAPMGCMTIWSNVHLLSMYRFRPICCETEVRHGQVKSVLQEQIRLPELIWLGGTMKDGVVVGIVAVEKCLSGEGRS